MTEYININDRVKQILDVINDVKKSGLPVRKYFSTNNTPFSRNQYYLYLKVHNARGLQGLYDHRKEGNAKKITPEIEHYLIGLLENNRDLTVSDIRSQLQRQFNIDIKRTAINDFRKKQGLERIDKPVQEYPFAGFEILSALAYHTGIFDVWSNTTRKHTENVKETDLFKENQYKGADHPLERNAGKLTPEYNRLEDVRKTKFDSIGDKVRNKDL